MAQQPSTETELPAQTSTEQMLSAQDIEIIRENNRLLKDLLRITKHVRTVSIARFVVTLLVVVLPIIIGILLAPRILEEIRQTFSSFQSSAIVLPNGKLQESLNKQIPGL